MAALAVASSLSCVPWLADAASLGKLTVLSGLGQPLRAEMEIGGSKEELAGMAVALASPEAFRQAGIDYASALLDLRFSIEKRGAGSIIKLSSGKPINEPFLDFLVELNWPAGRLVREYTFLLDPPELTVRQATRQVADAKIVETAEAVSSAPSLAPRPAPTANVAGKGPAEARREPEASRLVKAGDTLRRIAQENQHDGVSLEQMLVALYQNNREAFSGNNINRLKAGAILNIPERDAAAAIPEAEAKRVYSTHASNWQAYRHKLAAATAGAAAKEEGQAAQAASGKVTAKVDEKLTPAEQAKDQVKVARTDVAAGKAAGATQAAADEADRIAKDKALKEAQERLVLLEKNVGELQKLLEMKNRQLAELQQAQSAKALVPEKPLATAKPVETPQSVEPAKAEAVAEAAKAPSAEPARAETPPVPAETATPVAPPEAPKPVEPPKPVQSPKPPKPVVPPPPEPGFLDTLLEDPVPLAGGAGLLALLGAYLVLRRRRAQAAAGEVKAAPTTTAGPTENAVFQAAGGRSVDTDQTPPQTGDFSQNGPGAIDAGEVDPVAEADVYMAYGRDQQAEEILLDALQRDPRRLAIHVKLLEIYANRRSLKQFETLAGELYALTGGKGPEWQKVALLGHGIDPANPLYAAARELPAAAAGVALAGAGLQAASAEHAVPRPPEPVAEAAPVLLEEEIAVAGAPAVDDVMSLDFDLGNETPSGGEVSALAEAESLLPEETPGALDFDVGAGLTVALAPAASLSPATGEEAAPVAEFPEMPEISPLAFDLSVPETPAAVETPAVVQAAMPQAPGAADLDMHIDLDAFAETLIEPPAASAGGEDIAAKLDFDMALEETGGGQEAALPDFDLGTISLDLSAPEPSAEPSPAAPATAPEAVIRDAQWEEVNTKLDLAKAYEEMGDVDGARELLREVVQEGSPDLVATAQAALERIG